MRSIPISTSVLKLSHVVSLRYFGTTLIIPSILLNAHRKLPSHKSNLLFIYPFEILSYCHLLSYRSLVMKFSNNSGNFFITKAESFKLSDVLNNSHALNTIF